MTIEHNGAKTRLYLSLVGQGQMFPCTHIRGELIERLVTVPSWIPQFRLANLKRNHDSVRSGMEVQFLVHHYWCAVQGITDAYASRTVLCRLDPYLGLN